MKTLNDVIQEVQDNIAAQQTVLADLQALAAAPATTPAQQAVVDETITLFDGTVYTFADGVWTKKDPAQEQ
jgi:hypothetical protein